jgi:ATP-dependent exoDNAse (exonuclease V) beta subunit
MLLQEGISRDEINRGVLQVCNALTNLLQDERGRWLLAEHHEEQHNELSLTGLYEGQLITAVIDRTFIDEGGIRWIVDYKSSRHEGPDLDAFLDEEQKRYAGQLRKYGVLMQSLDERPIKLGLYYPLLKGWREWILEG